MPSETSFETAFREPGAVSRPICVGLDGALVATPLFSERLALLFRQRPWLVLALPFWLLGGRARLKLRIAETSRLDPVFLPYRRTLVAALAACRGGGRKVVLASSAERELAEQVATYLDLFDAVHVVDSSEGSTSLRESLAAAFPRGLRLRGAFPGRPPFARRFHARLLGGAPRRATCFRSAL